MDIEIKCFFSITLSNKDKFASVKVDGWLFFSVGQLGWLCFHSSLKCASSAPFATCGKYASIQNICPSVLLTNL